MQNRASVSVVVVCDYDAGGETEWSDLRRCLRALAAQDFEEPVEFILCESEDLRARMPGDLAGILPGLRILYFSLDGACALRNAGVDAASAEFVACIDADCITNRYCLRSLIKSIREHPNAAAVSARTVYPGKSLAIGTAGLLTRAFADPGHDGPTWHIVENAVIYRRAAYLEHPLPSEMGAFVAHVQAAHLLRAGYELWFDSNACVEHNFDGWPSERDIRNNRGYSSVRTRLAEPMLAGAWLMKLGRLAIVPLVAAKIFISWWDCIRCYRVYGVRWFELPVAMSAAVGLTLLEVPGMWSAFQAMGPAGTRFR